MMFELMPIAGAGGARECRPSRAPLPTAMRKHTPILVRIIVWVFMLEDGPDDDEPPPSPADRCRCKSVEGFNGPTCPFW
jgi:hypothetical protein